MSPEPRSGLSLARSRPPSGDYFDADALPSEPDCDELSEGIRRGDKVARQYADAVLATRRPLAEILAERIAARSEPEQEPEEQEHEEQRRKRLADRELFRRLALARAPSWARPPLSERCSWAVRTRSRERRSAAVRTRRTSRGSPARSTGGDDPPPSPPPEPLAARRAA
jgi:hypothetical protein